MALKNVYNKIYNKNLLYLLFEKLHLPIQKKKIKQPYNKVVNWIQISNFQKRSWKCPENMYKGAQPQV